MPVSRPKPPWLRKKIPSSGTSSELLATIREGALHTVCAEAHCPNQMECFSKGTATFLLLGPNCTRSCRFCAVGKLPVNPPDPAEPLRIAQAVAKMGVTFCVLTMVTRDDLSDGGSTHVARTIRAIRSQCPQVGVEVLISDLAGNQQALKWVLDAVPEVLNHNIETVPRLYATVRPQADYLRSIELLTRSRDLAPSVATKSGMMLGLGETRDEILAVMEDLRKAGCKLLTLGQYLAPSERHHPVVRFVTPPEFEDFKSEAQKRGFLGVASSPFVRSSYRAGWLYHNTLKSVST
ncbi:MAG: lipoyl synthase [Deltaproteobacteria bacterium]|nr:lipoyl synthase [Deltaproteobacteria bacterium]